jgi:hypothetical protein
MLLVYINFWDVIYAGEFIAGVDLLKILYALIFY